MGWGIGKPIHPSVALPMACAGIWGFFVATLGEKGGTKRECRIFLRFGVLLGDKGNPTRKRKENPRQATNPRKLV
jgi:hypothetical protein